MVCPRRRHRRSVDLKATRRGYLRAFKWKVEVSGERTAVLEMTMEGRYG